MANVEEARKKFFEAKKAVEDCQRAIVGLQNKHDTLEASLPEITQQIETAERLKRTSLDSYALHGDKQSESELRKARTAHEQAVRQQSETNELVEATNRALKKIESEFVTLQAKKDSLRHQVWNSLFEQKSAEIPASVRATVNELVTIGLQCSMGMNFILPKIFPLPTNSEIQKIYKELTTKFGISD